MSSEISAAQIRLVQLHRQSTMMLMETQPKAPDRDWAIRRDTLLIQIAQAQSELSSAEWRDTFERS